MVPWSSALAWWLCCWLALVGRSREESSGKRWGSLRVVPVLGLGLMRLQVSSYYTTFELLPKDSEYAAPT